MQMVFQIILLLFSIDAIFVQAADLASNGSSCQRSCGNVSNIPFPFGIGAGCYLDPWFEVVCNNSDSWASPKSVLKKLDLEVLNISLGGTVRVNYPTFVKCVDGAWSNLNTELRGSPFIFSQSQNRFIAIGCDNFASMADRALLLIGGCMSICGIGNEVVNASSCNGINCCQSTIPSDLDVFNTSMRPVNKEAYVSTEFTCRSAFLVEEKWFQKRGTINMNSIMPHVPVVLEWRIPNASFHSLPISYINGSASTANNSSPSYICNSKTTSFFSSSRNDVLTYTCSCGNGLEGNPYLLHGCQGKLFVPYTLFISLIFVFVFRFYMC